LVKRQTYTVNLVIVFRHCIDMSEMEVNASVRRDSYEFHFLCDHPMVETWRQQFNKHVDLVTIHNIVGWINDNNDNNDNIDSTKSKALCVSKIDEITTSLSKMCPDDDVSEQYSRDCIRFAFEKVNDSPHSTSYKSMLFGMDVSGFKEDLFTNKSLTDACTHNVYGYLIWSNANIDLKELHRPGGMMRNSEADERGDRLAPLVFTLDLYFARKSTCGSYVDSDTLETVRFNTLVKHGSRYTFDNAHSSSCTTVSTKRVTHIKYDVIGVGDLMMCTFLMWAKKQYRSSVILEVSVPVGESYGERRADGMQLYHRYIEYGFLEVPALTLNINCFKSSRPSDQCATLPSMICPLERINVNDWVRVLCERGHYKVFMSLEEHYKSLPNWLESYLEYMDNQKDDINTAYKNYQECHKRHIQRQLYQKEKEKLDTQRRAPSTRMKHSTAPTTTSETTSLTRKRKCMTS